MSFQKKNVMNIRYCTRLEYKPESTAVLLKLIFARFLKPNKIFFAILAVFLITTAPSAYGLRCKNRIISIGDTKLEVMSTCGQPVIMDESTGESVVIIYEKDGKNKKETRNKTRIKIEEWTYNFGKNEFIAFLTFENGYLTKIEQGSYGYDGDLPDFDPARCGHLVSTGDMKIEVLMRCGKATLIDTKTEETVKSVNKGEKTYETTYNNEIEEWTYNFGPDRFMYIFRFNNGKVVEIEQKGYGF